MGIAQRISEFRSGFSSTFWIANTLELFERLAFYGAKAVLVTFLLEKVGLLNEAATLAGIFSALIYALPILAGVLVDRYGFKKTLATCFLIFCVGYFLIGMAGMEFGAEIVNAIGKRTYTLIVLILTAIGGSLIKPCIVGTVAKTTTQQTKSLGYSIYYTLVNIGGAIGPILALLIRENLGIESVLIMSSVTSFLLFIGTLIFFKEPGELTPEETRTFKKVFRDMLLVFANFRFITFLVIYSGFWLMFWQIFYLVPQYGIKVLDFHKFELLEAVDAICIIFLTVPMAFVVKKLKPIAAMSLGFFFASFSWIIMGAIPTATATIVAIALYALGEATQAPRFYEYVASLAPKGQIGTFMGFAFLPVAIGSFGAGVVADWLRITYLDSDPAMMWYIVASIGFVSTLLLLLYNIFLAPRPAST
jgi:POT family proton-dependent oligopeptide transporter